MRVAELDEARALGMHGHGALDGDAAKLVGLTFGRAHLSPDVMTKGELPSAGRPGLRRKLEVHKRPFNPKWPAKMNANLKSRSQETNLTAGFIAAYSWHSRLAEALAFQQAQS